MIRSIKTDRKDGHKKNANCKLIVELNHPNDENKYLINIKWTGYLFNVPIN